ncbi:sulfotransferase [Sphingomonas radiodurans]|uniref:sulfotransferase n=1 Tax=Sphingomonas radiodurans TaxID=2890321 RepID=UPI001E2E88CB|nr:sulfotransferase [Sphingomonas radiodurans]WBH16456.1 sulfotransferase [Sphingomonas radiodurans]
MTRRFAPSGEQPLRIAMWSGPRNISTAMMRSFSSRSDCAVSDEPFYGCFLNHSRADHPMRDAVVASMDCEWRSVATTLAGPAPEGRAVWYQKHMPHHMVGPVAPDDLVGVTHAFLIRDPARIAASYAAKRETVTAQDLGIAKQRAFFDREAERLGTPPPVIDSADVLRDPAGTLGALCAALGIEWDPAMLSWPAGRHPADGIWAAHWYGRVEASTGFAGPDAPAEPLPRALAEIAGARRSDYEAMAAYCLIGTC